MSLHQVGLARQFSDRVAGLAGGRLVFEGVSGRAGRQGAVRHLR